MRFCASCRRPLEFLEFLDGDLCSACQTNDRPSAGPSRKSEPAQSPALESLPGATFIVENGKLVLTSAEGWILWSGPADQANSLENILQRARRINDIRKKRQAKD